MWKDLAELSENLFRLKSKDLAGEKKNSAKNNSEFGMIRGGSRLYSKTLGGVVEAWKPKLADRLFRGSSGTPCHHREYPD